jgi:hypothetical protein
MSDWAGGADEDWQTADDDAASSPWRLPDPLDAPTKPRWSQEDAGPMYRLLKALAMREEADRAAVEALLRTL